MSALAPDAITLVGNYTRTNFVAERAVLMLSIGRVPTLANDARFADSERDNAKVALMTRAQQFRNAVLSKVADKNYRDKLPAAPNFSSDLSKFSKPLHTMTTIWERINEHQSELSLSGPLTLQVGYTEAMFAADIETLAVLTNAANKSESIVGFARSTRNTQMAAIYARLKQYRAGAASDLPKTSPALEHLPRLTPPPGTTPPTLGATGDWNSATLMADLSWSLSKAKDVTKLQIRGCTGGTYKNDEEEVVADLPATATSWSGDWGLTAPGAIASFKAYVVNYPLDKLRGLSLIRKD